MEVGGNESIVLGFENEGGNGRVESRLGNEGNNLPISNSKFTSTVNTKAQG